MKELKTTVSGIYPKLINSTDTPHLKRSLHKFDQKELTSEELETVIQKNISTAITEMREAGVTIFNDSLIRWTDFFSPFSKSFKGLSQGTLKRVFDTNTLQRKPKVTDSIEWQENTATSDLAYAKSLLQEGEGIKATIPGPFTFFDAVDNTYYEKKEDLINDLAKALNSQIKEYEKLGADFIEIYDPILSFGRENLEVYKIFLNDIKTPVILGGFYGTPQGENLNQISDLISGFTIDAASSDVIPDLNKKIIQIGIFDARTTARDDQSLCQQKVEKIMNKFPDSEVFLALNNSPEFLPRENAKSKIKALSSLI